MNIINEALYGSKPIKELISIAEEKYFLGENKSQILKEFDQLCDSLEDEDTIDIVLEVMDIIDGWCSPNRDININKSNISVEDYLYALNNIKDHIDTKKKKMLKVHYLHERLTHADLAKYADIPAPKLVNIEYGEIGHLICRALHFPSIIEKRWDKPIWRSIFASKRDNMLILNDAFRNAIKQSDWILKA